MGSTFLHIPVAVRITSFGFSASAFLKERWLQLLSTYLEGILFASSPYNARTVLLEIVRDVTTGR